MRKGRKKKKGGVGAKPASFDHRPFAKVGLPSGEDRLDPVNDRDAGFADFAPRTDSDPADDDILREMANGVVPLGDDKRLVEKKTAARPVKAEMDDAELVMRHLDDLVHGGAPFELAETEEYVEAAVKGLDRRVVRRLRRGEFSVQAHLDLHGYRKDEARREVARFIGTSVERGRRCVLIVHGRGLGSKDNIPVLKEKLTAWLTRGAIGRRVLAFTSARPWDGGTGAVYVLLRG